MNYTATNLANGDLIINAAGSTIPVAWSDATFQSWLAQQAPDIRAQFSLSIVQQTIQTLRGLTYAQWQANVTPAQKDRIIFELVQRVSLSNGTV